MKTISTIALWIARVCAGLFAGVAIGVYFYCMYLLCTSIHYAFVNHNDSTVYIVIVACVVYIGVISAAIYSLTKRYNK